MRWVEMCLAKMNRIRRELGTRSIVHTDSGCQTPA
jgi:hypothetical protein